MTHSTRSTYDAMIIGAGLVGLTAALALSYKGLSVALIDRVDPIDALAPDYDGRASAVSASSLQMLKTLNVATKCARYTQAMRHIVIADGQVGAVSPLTLSFERDARSGPSGYMIENKRLRMALYDTVIENKSVDFFAPANIDTMIRSESGVDVALADGPVLKADVLIAADGRNSRTRQEAGIGVEMKVYKQYALTTSLSHSRSHQETAYEIFYPNGPFALLPLTGRKSSLVWSDKETAIKAALNLPEEALREEIARRTNGLLGRIEISSKPLAYPLSLQISERYTGHRLALIGDAAHAIHPIAGQGLNMGFRDVAALADTLSNAKNLGLDIGGASLSEYEVWRNFDNRTLAIGTDVLNQLFSNNIRPFTHIRRLGMTFIQALPALKTGFIKEAAGEAGVLPSLLREI